MRNERLDILRCIAILLVFGRHGFIYGTWMDIGWAGVDLFFVLSGFLISGLLFSEYQKTGEISLKRFYLRRGFKIYPAFWAMLLGSYFIALIYKLHVPFMLWRREFLFIQNYKPGLWRHTWSLAVEEHFYIVLPIFLLILLRFARDRRNPFKLVPYAFCGLAIGCLVMRYVAVYLRPYKPEEFWVVMFSTHLRIDALFCGVVVSYYYHFRPELIRNLLATFRNRLMLEAATALCLGICVMVPVDSPLMQSLGLTLVYIGFAGLLVIVMSARTRETSSSGIKTIWSGVGRSLAYVGVYSYSIYLWHVPVSVYGVRSLARISTVPLSPAWMTYVYALMSIVVGIVMAKLIELPMLKLRDRLFPRSSAFTVSNATLINEAVLDPAPSPALVHSS